MGRVAAERNPRGVMYYRGVENGQGGVKTRCGENGGFITQVREERGLN